jgi:hypothetical protein
VIALGTSPVTIAGLRQGLVQLRGRPAVTGRSWWESFTAGIGDVVQVRSRSNAVGDPIADADRALAAGDVARAIALVEKLPLDANRGAIGWVQSARRYQAGIRGLSALEEAALGQAPAAVLPIAPTS